MTEQGWICENGHHVPDRSHTNCPDCKAARGTSYRGLASKPAPTQSKVAWATAGEAQSTIRALLIGGVVVALAAGAILGASWPDPLGDGSSAGLVLGWALVAAAQLMIFVGAVAAGVRLGIKAAS